jgi:cytoskeletal protein RodZ
MANFGETLKQARAHKGVTLKEAEQATRINRNHLAALEDENFAALPPLIYQRGIVRNYAMYLKLDAAQMLGEFEDRRGGDVDPKAGSVTAGPPLNMPSHWAPNFAIIAFAVVLSAIVFAWTYSAFVQPTEGGGESTEIVATVTPYASQLVLPTEQAPTPTAAPSPTPAPTQAPAPQERVESGRPVSTSESAGSNGSTGSDNQLAGSAEESDGGEQTLAENASPDEPQTLEETATEPPAQTDNAFVTSISVYAAQPITISVVTDGVAVFEGSLAQGEATPFFDGSVFEVYTTSGSSTLFTNSCSDVPFNMGYDGGEAVYQLEADASSCAPIGG